MQVQRNLEQEYALLFGGIARQVELFGTWHSKGVAEFGPRTPSSGSDPRPVIVSESASGSSSVLPSQYQEGAPVQVV
eukprot:2100221-Rhodomonas_salina.2